MLVKIRNLTTDTEWEDYFSLSLLKHNCTFYIEIKKVRIVPSDLLLINGKFYYCVSINMTFDYIAHEKLEFAQCCPIEPLDAIERLEEKREEKCIKTVQKSCVIGV